MTKGESAAICRDRDQSPVDLEARVMTDVHRPSSSAVGPKEAACDRSHLCARAPDARPVRAFGAVRDAPDLAALDAVTEAGKARLASLVRRLRVERALSTRQLAATSTLARSTITRIEAALLRPRRSMLVALAFGFAPENWPELLPDLVDAATPAMVTDTRGWQHYRLRHITQGLWTRTIPLPADLVKRIAMHQAAGSMLLEAQELWYAGRRTTAADMQTAAHLETTAAALRAEAGPFVSAQSLAQQIKKELR